MWVVISSTIVMMSITMTGSNSATSRAGQGSVDHMALSVPKFHIAPWCMIENEGMGLVLK